MSGSFTPQQRAYIRKRSAHHELDPSEVAGELNIIPFLDIVVNIIMFLLATTETVLAIAQIEANLPTLGRGGRGVTAAPALNLNVTVTSEGIIVAGAGGKLAPGCENTAGGRVVTVPKVGGSYDWNGLTECVAKIKGQFPDEDSVTMSADPTVEYEHFVHAMDAVREKGERQLFPRVQLSAGVR